jgi:hypothetical protein
MKKVTGIIVIIATAIFLFAQQSSGQQTLAEKVGQGLNVIIVHPAHDNAEMQAIAVNHPAFGATWREKDLNYVLSQKYRDLLKEYNIQLLT